MARNRSDLTQNSYSKTCGECGKHFRKNDDYKFVRKMFRLHLIKIHNYTEERIIYYLELTENKNINRRIFVRNNIRNRVGIRNIVQYKDFKDGL